MSLCAQTNTSQQKLDACEAYFGERQCRIITTAADVSSSIDGYKFDLNGIDENYTEKKYVVWLTTDDETGVPSVSSSQTLVPVVYVEDDSANEIATLLKSAIDALQIFKTEKVDSVLHIRNKFLGAVAVETNAAAEFEFEVGKVGFGGSLGAFAPGGASLSTEVTVEQVFSDQQGEILLDEIIKGMTLSLEVTLAEMTQARWESLIGSVSGGIVEASGSKLVGYGTAKLFQSKLQYAGMLVLHPIALPNSDRSSDYVIHKTAPDMGSINFSGSELQGAEMVFNAYRDTSVNSAIDLFSKGDYTLL